YEENSVFTVDSLDDEGICAGGYAFSEKQLHTLAGFWLYTRKRFRVRRRPVLFVLYRQNRPGAADQKFHASDFGHFFNGKTVQAGPESRYMDSGKHLALPAAGSLS